LEVRHASPQLFFWNVDDSLKQRDGGVDHVVLLLADTRANRAFRREFGDVLRVNYPVDGRVALAALAAGRDPGGGAVILL